LMFNSEFKMAALIFLLFIVLALVVVAVKSVINVKENERLVVFRLGKLLRVYGSGLAILIPFVDKGVKVNVESIAEGRRLSEKELEERAVQMALQGNR
jgi:regulator of protease activity HflC (stomatin/prohibitin superfamily)